MKFGDNLRDLRKNQKMTQEQLAEKVGVSRQSVSKWENGESYPEMNNIMILCDIFHCKINNLVNDSLLDIDSLNEDVKINIVKFKKEKQQKVRFLSKLLYLLAEIMNVIVSTGIVFLAIAIIAIPIVINRADIENASVELFGKYYTYEINNNEVAIYKDGNLIKKINIETTTDLSTYIPSHTNSYYIVTSEVIDICLMISLILIAFMLKNLKQLFLNIHNGDTPFTLENVKYIKFIALYLSLNILFSYISGKLFEIFTKIDMNIKFELIEVVYIIIIFSLSYIFEYGYEIQLDSKGRIYDEK